MSEKPISPLRQRMLESAAEQTSGTDPGQPLAHSCPHCGRRMVIIDTFDAGCQPRHRPTTPLGLLRIDTS